MLMSRNAAVVARAVGDVVPAEDGPDVTTLRTIFERLEASGFREPKAHLTLDMVGAGGLEPRPYG
jgi:hypothetical protein